MDRHDQIGRGLTRRGFVRSTAAMAAMPLVARMPGRVGGDAGRAPMLKVGLIGCGGRGTGAASQALAADDGAVLTAMADVFADRLATSLGHLQKAAADRVKVDEAHRFVGLDAYQRLIDSGVDVVILATPPAFRPAHLRAAVDAGKHIFTEKPMAVDGPGLRSVMASAQKAREKGLSLVSGFCWRYSAAERATYARIHEGGLGEIRAIYATYNATPLRTNPRQEDWSDLDFQLRNWQHMLWLSGDHILEQAVHSIDKIAWAMKDVPPVRAVAVGGRQARADAPETGNVWDHFAVTYEFGDGARGFLMARQMARCATDNSDLIMGSTGVCDLNGWAPRHVITGEKPWKYEGPYNSMYQQEHDELFASIRNGKPMNDGEWMCNSTAMGLMGRMAAYTGQTVTWDQVLNSEESLVPEDLTAAPALRPVATPGVTKLL